jgi:hypothetical protein
VNQSELRDLLYDKADEFSLNSRIPTHVMRRAKRRVVLSTLGTGLALVLLVLSAGTLVTQLRQQTSSPHLIRVPLAIELVDYYDDSRHQGEDARKNPIASRDEATRHAACMREQGFDLPSPTRTQHGWDFLIEDPKALGFNTRKWREAAFVTCRPDPPLGPGDLIIGAEVLSDDDIVTFRSCMKAEGLRLPLPARSGENKWRFDTSRSDLDISSDALPRAVFVTCWPGEAD